MRTSKVTTLVLMTLVWWALSPETTVRSDLPVQSSISSDRNNNIAVNGLP